MATSATRARRRAQARTEKKLSQLYKNGLTEKDLQEQYEKGYRAGYQDRAWEIIQSYHGATTLALNEGFGFGKQRCLKALNQIETNLISFLTNQELIEEAEKKVGIEIHLDEGIFRAQPK